MVEKLFEALLQETGVVAALEFLGLVAMWFLLKAEKKECEEQRKEHAVALTKMADAIYALNGLLQRALSKGRSGV